MEQVRYADFSTRLHRRALGRRVPLSGSVEVTRRCPLRCVHCYNNLAMDDHETRWRELTCEEHCRILDEIAGAGCLWLLYTGGEIFARTDFLDIYTYAKQKGLLVTLFTNGTLVTAKVADHLAQWRPFSIEITLYGRTRQVHERVTGVPGSYERSVRAIRLFRERRLPLRIKTMALTLNRHEIGDLRRFVEEELGLEFRFDPMLNCRLDCSRGPLAVRLTPEEVVALDLQDPKRLAEWKRFAEQFNRPADWPEQLDQLYSCGAGIQAFAVDPWGGLGLCALAREEAYDLRNGSFRAGWEHFLSKIRQKKITRRTKCVACQIKAMCGMCPANAELENQDSELPVDFLCRVAHLRARVLGLPVAPHGDCEYCCGGIYCAELLRSAHELQSGRVAEQDGSSEREQVFASAQCDLSRSGQRSPRPEL